MEQQPKHGDGRLDHIASLFPLTQTSFCFQVGPIEGTSFTLKAVRPQAKYCIQVAALDLTDYGESSAWSLPAVASVTLGK